MVEAMHSFEMLTRQSPAIGLADRTEEMAFNTNLQTLPAPPTTRPALPHRR